MGKYVYSAICIVLVIGLLIVCNFFGKNPFRVGEITFATPNGPSMSFKVANTNEISELIRKGLADERSSEMLSNTLLSIIEHLPPGCTLGEKLVELVERRRPPFLVKSVPVNLLLHDENLPEGLAAACENSCLLSKNVVVYVLKNNNEMMTNIPAHVDGTLAFPCPDGGEVLRVNSQKVKELGSYRIMAKQTF